MATLASRWNALPRAAKWCVLGAGVAVAYLGVIEPVLRMMDSVGARADRIERDLARRKDLATSDGGDGKQLADLQAVFGRVKIPDPQTTPESIYRVVDQTLESHDITDRSISERTVPLTSDGLTQSKLGKHNRLILEVTFEADARSVVSIVSELERSPLISAVSRVRMDKSGVRPENSVDPRSSDLVRATIAAEAWLVVSGSEVRP